MHMPKTQHMHQTLAFNSTGYNIFNDVDNDAVVPKRSGCLNCTVSVLLAAAAAAIWL